MKRQFIQAPGGSRNIHSQPRATNFFQPRRLHPPSQEGDQQSPSAGRPRSLLMFLLLLSLAVTWRLFQISVEDHHKLQQIADSQQYGQAEVEADRGQIYLQDDPDQKSTFAVAKNIDTYALAIVPRNIVDIDTVASTLEPIAKIPAADIKQAYLPVKEKLYLAPLKHGLTTDEKQAIEAKNLPGVFLTREPRRFYPEKQLAAQVIGFVNAENKGYGVEATYNDELTGSAGKQIGLKNLRGGFISVAEATPAEDGTSYVLTIDRNVQYIVEEKLRDAVKTYQADSGSVDIIDIKTGAIIAMAQTPTFDLNEFNKVDPNNQAVFQNVNLNVPWEPGSIMKPLIIGAALDAGVINTDFTGTYGASVTVQGKEIHTSINKAYGKETLAQILENSDNVAMVDIGGHLGNEKMYNAFEKFGFLGKTGVDVGGEVSGQVLPLKQWSEIRRATMSFGQGISTTPLQILQNYAAIANNGQLMRPYLIANIKHQGGSQEDKKPEPVRQIMSPDTAKQVTAMLRGVVVLGHGKKAAIPGYTVAGKTGTAQIPKAQGGGYEDGVTIGSFAGFFPVSNPRFAMIVKIDRPKAVEFAESSAAPTFAEIASFLASYYRIPPDTNGR